MPCDPSFTRPHNIPLFVVGEIDFQFSFVDVSGRKTKSNLIPIQQTIWYRWLNFYHSCESSGINSKEFVCSTEEILDSLYYFFYYSILHRSPLLQNHRFFFSKLSARVIHICIHTIFTFLFSCSISYKNWLQFAFSYND